MNNLSLLNWLAGGLEFGNALFNLATEERRKQYIAQQFKFNEDIANLQQQEAIYAGTIKQNIFQERTAQLSSAQKAAEAAQGVDISSFGPAFTRLQTGEIGGIDYLTIANNAYLEGLGYQIKKENYAISSMLEQNEAEYEKRRTLLGGVESLYQSGIKALAYAQMPVQGVNL